MGKRNFRFGVVLKTFYQIATLAALVFQHPVFCAKEQNNLPFTKGFFLYYNDVLNETPTHQISVSPGCSRWIWVLGVGIHLSQLIIYWFSVCGWMELSSVSEDSPAPHSLWLWWQNYYMINIMVDVINRGKGMAIERVSNTFEGPSHLHYHSPGRHLVCVKGYRVTGTVFLSLQQRKYIFPQTFNSTGDHHCRIFGI